MTYLLNGMRWHIQAPWSDECTDRRVTVRVDYRLTAEQLRALAAELLVFANQEDPTIP